MVRVGTFPYTVGLMCDVHSDEKIDLEKIKYIGLGPAMQMRWPSLH